MNDDRILKPRFRLCPYCGGSGYPEIRVSGAGAFVRCNVCRADGPWYDITGYLSDDFHELTQEEKDDEWSNAMIAAQHDAMKAWNRRPWDGSYFPEELEDLEKYAKTDTAALYGKCVSEEAERKEITDGSCI